MFAGVHDPSARGAAGERAALAARGLAARPDGTLAEASVGIAWRSCDAAGEGAWTCIVAGHLDNATELTAAHGLDPGATAATVVGALIGRYGEAGIAELRGDFAVVAWDRRSHHGLLARDRLGGGPLFVHVDGRRLAFATEVRPLLALLGRRPGPDDVFWAHWLAGLDAREGRTPFAGVRALVAGEVLRFGEEGVRSARYWTPAPPVSPDGDLGAHAERLRGVLGTAVRRKTGGRPAGSLLSGGLDSSAITALSATQDGGATRIYSLAFPTLPAMDESAFVEAVGTAYGLGGSSFALAGGSMLAGALAFPERWDVPLRPQNLPLMAPLVGRAFADGARVLLDGEGGDLLFLPVRELMADRVRAGRPDAAVGLARRLPGAGARPPRRRVAELALAHGLRPALPRGAGLRGPQSPPWLRPAPAAIVRDADLERAWARRAGPRWWAKRVDEVYEAAPALGARDQLRRRAAAASPGLRAASPFFDADVVDLVLAAPPELAYDPGLDRPLLRAAMTGLLPEPVRGRSGKVYFNPLLEQSLARDDLAEIKGLLGAPGAEVGAYADLETTRALFVDRDPADHPGGIGGWCAGAWRLVTAEAWLRHETDPSFGRRILEGGRLRPVTGTFASRP